MLTSPSSSTPNLPPSHQKAVSNISSRVAAFHASRTPFRISHGSTNSTRAHHGSPTIDISSLSQILIISSPLGSSSSAFALVEPNVPMDALVHHCLKHGLVPPIVMEFPGITVGGGFAGSAGESSSWREGYFDSIISGVEVVLGNGDVVWARKHGERKELYEGVRGSLGTLGVVTCLEVRLVKAKRWVRLEYGRVGSVREGVECVKAVTEKGEDGTEFVDGILFGPQYGVIMTGRMIDEVPKGLREVRFSRPWDEWFYLHVQKRTRNMTSSDEVVVDYIPLDDYLFRYDRGGFWVGRLGFKYFYFPFTRFTRWLLDDFMHTRMLYRALHGAGRTFGYIVQDLSLPYSTGEEFINWSVQETGIWPLWLCPLAKTERPTWHPSTTLPEIEGEKPTAKPMLNIGLWGFATKSQKRFVEINRALEKKLEELGGRKVLYSQTFYTEEEFDRIYAGEKEWYESLRRNYHAECLPTVYDKVRTVDQRGAGLKPWLVQMWPIEGFRGLYHALRSGDWRMHKAGRWRQVHLGSDSTKKID